MAVSVKSYTHRFLVIAILAIIAVWALLFYAVLMDEVYDNIDDGLKNQKLEIIREAYSNPDILENSGEFGINQFRILPAAGDRFLEKNRFSKELVYMPYEDEDEPYRILRTGFYSKDRKPYQLEIRTSTVEEDDFLMDLAFSLAVLYVVIVLSILLINYVVLNRAWKPFNKILDNLSRYRFGSTTTFVPVASRIEEFNQLNEQILRMIDRNEQLFQQQKRFIENASHELQTPLAITINKLDLLMDDESLGEIPLTKIAEAKQSLLRLVGLNKSLLTLSRIENHQYHQIEDVDFNQLIKTLMDDLADIINFREIEAAINEEDVFIARCNKDLAHILLSNLLRNAIKYSPDGGKIVVRIGRTQIAIRNTGISEALNPDYIFERFHKSTQDAQSNGLGLSIVRSIVENYPHMHISYTFEDGMHVFSLLQSEN